MTDKDELLQKILEALEQRGFPKAIIRRLPKDSDGLGDLVRLVVVLRQMPHPKPPPMRALPLLNTSERRITQAARQREIRSANGHGQDRKRRSQPVLILHPSSRLIGASIVFLLALAILLSAGAWVLAGPRNARAATFINLQGQVQVTAVDGIWRSVAEGDLIHAGERIRTGTASQATLVFFEGSRTTVGANSELAISRLDGDWGNVLQVVLNQYAGESSHSVVPLRGAKSIFMVFTPSGKANVRGTNFSVAVEPHGLSRFSVNTGQVLVSNQVSQVSLQSGQALAFTAGETLGKPAYQFTRQGELNEKGETIWAVEGNTFLVTPETLITGDPQVGATVLVEGRIRDEGWVADSVEFLGFNRIQDQGYPGEEAGLETGEAAEGKSLPGEKTVEEDSSTEAVNPGDESGDVLEEEAVEENPDTDAVNRGDESMAAPEAEVVKKDPDKDAADRRDPEAIAAPYKDYIVTQGPHGFSYGQMAVDLSAGNGAKILSPINGVVTGVYFDEYGNSTLEIENKIYVVTLLHGDYKVDEGDVVKIGEPVGRESNQGYTVNMYGVPCYGRAGCGYHTHLNIYDKRIGSNVNPLDLIGK